METLKVNSVEKRKEYQERYRNTEKYKTWFKAYRIKNRLKTNSYHNEWSRKRRIDMQTGKAPWSKQFQRQIDNWVDKTYKELKYLDEHMHEGHIDLRRLDALSKL